LCVALAAKHAADLRLTARERSRIVKRLDTKAGTRLPVPSYRAGRGERTGQHPHRRLGDTPPASRVNTPPTVGCSANHPPVKPNHPTGKAPPIWSEVSQEVSQRERERERRARTQTVRSSRAQEPPGASSSTTVEQVATYASLSATLWTLPLRGPYTGNGWRIGRPPCGTVEPRSATVSGATRRGNGRIVAGRPGGRGRGAEFCDTVSREGGVAGMTTSNRSHLDSALGSART
jgi:hypothetical protein